MPYEISTEVIFSAAHYLEDYPGDCARLHGHNWRVRVFVRADQRRELGLTLDFRKLKAILQDVLKYLDHKVLNELDEFRTTNPTAEAIAEWIYNKVQARVGGGVTVSKVEVWESPTNCATFIGG